MDEISMKTPIGRLVLVENDGNLISVTKNDTSEVSETLDNEILNKAKYQLEEYFSGERTTFVLPIEPIGTLYQKKVWEALREIPYSDNVTYAIVAEKVNTPKAYRAVGTAIGKNPLLIITPCHRVINKNFRLNSFSAGVDAKDWLNEHERRINNI